MTRALFTLCKQSVRDNVMSIICNAPDWTRVEISEPRRTLPQNKRMWAMLSDISRQCEHMGRKYTIDEWKCLFLHALGRECEFIPALDGKGFIPYRQSSSELTVEEMTGMIELMFKYGAENNVMWTNEVASHEI